MGVIFEGGDIILNFGTSEGFGYILLTEFICLEIRGYRNLLILEGVLLILEIGSFLGTLLIKDIGYTSKGAREGLERTLLFWKIDLGFILESILLILEGILLTPITELISNFPSIIFEGNLDDIIGIGAVCIGEGIALTWEGRAEG